MTDSARDPASDPGTDPGTDPLSDAGTEPARRRYPSTFGGLIYIIVVAVTVVGLGLATFGPWRRGIALIGVALVFAAAMRLVTRESEAGMLRVRGRWFDVVVLAGVGIALVALAANIPDQTLP